MGREGDVGEEALERTVSAGLDGSLDIPNALDGNTVLVVSIHVLVLQFANFIEKHAELVCDIGYVFIAVLAPE